MVKIQYGFVLLIGLAGFAVPTGSSPVYAQGISDRSNGHFYWVNGGLGVNSLFEVASAGISVSYQTGKHLLSLSSVFYDESQLLGFSASE